MAREWQQTRYKEYVMPDAVYYQSLWAVRDLQRMTDRLSEIKGNGTEGSNTKSVSVVKDGGKTYNVSRPTEQGAMEVIILEERINAINSALEEVPEGYREFVMTSIVSGTGKEFPSRLWKYWKQRFLFRVAKNLSMI